MYVDIASGVGAFAVGTLLSFVNYRISRAILEKSAQNYAVGTVIKQIVSVLWLLACFFIGENTEISTIALLIGAALGVTLPSLLFTPKLLKMNQKSEGKNTEGKDGGADG